MNSILVFQILEDLLRSQETKSSQWQIIDILFFWSNLRTTPSSDLDLNWFFFVDPDVLFPHFRFLLF